MCSFYANWSGIIRESLAMVSNDLQEKQNVKNLITSTNLVSLVTLLTAMTGSLGH